MKKNHGKCLAYVTFLSVSRLSDSYINQYTVQLLILFVLQASFDMLVLQKAQNTAIILYFKKRMHI